MAAVFNFLCSSTFFFPDTKEGSNQNEKTVPFRMA
jgi:hypothetical protein